MVRRAEPRRFAILRRVGIRPSVAEVVNRELDAAFAAAPPDAAVLDAGCGRVSALKAYRSRIGRFVGADIHEPDPALSHLDEFVCADLCADRDAFGAGSFDVILSSFTVEHFADPGAAFANMRAWLRPGGRLVISTVNRRHPFVAAYLVLPAALRSRLQRLVKASAADAHPLVGACNSVPAVESTLVDAGFADVRVSTVGHLARAWGRRWPTWALGFVGDLLAQPIPSARSTIVAVAIA
jgi:SAM-dependent methyltransferase